MQYVQVEKLSGGEKRRLYLMTVLMRNPNFLILDEPTNDLDIVTLNVLEDYLSGFNGCLIIVSHDRFFMDKLVDHLFIFEGDGVVCDFPGNYSEYRASVKLEEQEASRQKAIQQAGKLKSQSTPKANSQDKKRLSYKETKELEQLEADLHTLDTEKKHLEEALNSGSLNAGELMEKSHRIGEVLKLIDEKMMRWIFLSELIG
jgi:ATP-binding cassette subfamily F protein uup